MVGARYVSWYPPTKGGVSSTPNEQEMPRGALHIYISTLTDHVKLSVTLFGTVLHIYAKFEFSAQIWFGVS